MTTLTKEVLRAAACVLAVAAWLATMFLVVPDDPPAPPAGETAREAAPRRRDR